MNETQGYNQNAEPKIILDSAENPFQAKQPENIDDFLLRLAKHKATLFFMWNGIRHKLDFAEKKIHVADEANQSEANNDQATRMTNTLKAFTEEDLKPNVKRTGFWDKMRDMFEKNNSN